MDECEIKDGIEWDALSVAGTMSRHFTRYAGSAAQNKVALVVAVIFGRRFHYPYSRWTKVYAPPVTHLFTQTKIMYHLLA